MTQMIPMILRENASAEVSWGEEGGREGGREGRREGGREGMSVVGTDIPVSHSPRSLWCSVAEQSE